MCLFNYLLPISSIPNKFTILSYFYSIFHPFLLNQTTKHHFIYTLFCPFQIISPCLFFFFFYKILCAIFLCHIKQSKNIISLFIIIFFLFTFFTLFHSCFLPTKYSLKIFTNLSLNFIFTFSFPGNTLFKLLIKSVLKYLFTHQIRV